MRVLTVARGSLRASHGEALRVGGIVEARLSLQLLTSKARPCHSLPYSSPVGKTEQGLKGSDAVLEVGGPV